MSEQHQTEVVFRRSFTMPSDWRAECSCGWVGDNCMGINQAHREADDHKDEMEAR